MFSLEKNKKLEKTTKTITTAANCYLFFLLPNEAFPIHDVVHHIVGLTILQILKT
jgi:hypothetical protein